MFLQASNNISVAMTQVLTGLLTEQPNMRLGCCGKGYGSMGEIIM